MNIGIDIDGVLTNEHKWHIEAGSKYFGELYNIYIKDSTAFSTSEIFGVTLEKEKEFWENNIWEYAKDERPRKYIKEIFEKLKDDNHKIYIITAREYTWLDTNLGEKMRDTVKKWLEKNELFYNDIIFTDKSKLNVCKEKNIDLMIEDNTKNIKEISTHIPVICMDESYNKSCIGDNIFRCYSWYDIYYKIKDINKSLENKDKNKKM